MGSRFILCETVVQQFQFFGSIDCNWVSLFVLHVVECWQSLVLRVPLPVGNIGILLPFNSNIPLGSTLWRHYIHKAWPKGCDTNVSAYHAIIIYEMNLILADAINLSRIISMGGIPTFLHNSPANFESYAKNRYAKLCKSMQNYAKICKIMQKTFWKFKKFEISLENNPLITTRFFRWSDFVHNNPFILNIFELSA